MLVCGVLRHTKAAQFSGLAWETVFLLPIVLLQHLKHLVALGNVGPHAFGA